MHVLRFLWLTAIAVALVLSVAGLRLWWAAEAHAPASAPKKSAEALPGTGSSPVVVVAEDDATITVRHVLGTVTIPRHPKRVAVLGWNDEVVALGVMPVAAGGDGWRGFAPFLREGMKNAALVDNSGGGPNLEALAASAPDLIVATSLWPDSGRGLERIAPTVVLETAQSNWRQRFRDLALVLDRRAEGEARLQKLEQRIAETRAAIHARIGAGSVAMVRVFAREYRLYGREYSGPLLYEDLGLTVPKLVRDDAWGREVLRLSIEGLCRLDADHILLMTEEHIPVSFQVRDRLTTHPLWTQLPAVRAGHMHLVPDLVMRGGIIGRELSLDLLRQALCPDDAIEGAATAGAVAP